MKPWNQTLADCQNFEDVYAWVASWLPPGQHYIGQVTTYDVALRLILLSGKQNLQPSRSLYLHALPWLAYRWLHEIKVFPIHAKNDSTVPFASIAPSVAPLDARLTEDFLCHIGKVVRRLCEQKPTREHLSAITIADVLAALPRPSRKRTPSRVRFNCC